MIKPQGGPEDWRALFHEAGHTEHFAHTSPSLSVEERRLGDNAVTEGWAMLLEHLTIDPVWLERRLDFPRPLEFAAEGATQLLWLLRRYCAKLLYELEFHAAATSTAMRRATSSCSSEATKVTPSHTDYLDDIDDGFYASEYLRAWAFEAQLRAYLRERFGNAWFARARRRLAAARAVGRGSEADGGRDPARGDRRDARARRSRPVREALARRS